MYTQHYQPQHPILQQFEPSARCAMGGNKEKCMAPELEKRRLGVWKNGTFYKNVPVQNWVELGENVYLAYLDLPDDPENFFTSWTTRQEEKEKKQLSRTAEDTRAFKEKNERLAATGFTFIVGMGKSHFSEDYDLVIDTPQIDQLSFLNKFKTENESETAKKKQFWRKFYQYDDNRHYEFYTKNKDDLKKNIKTDKKEPRPEENKRGGKNKKWRREERYEKDLEKITLHDVKTKLKNGLKPALKQDVEVLINYGTAMDGSDCKWQTDESILGDKGDNIESTTNLNSLKGWTRGSWKTWGFQIKRKKSGRDVPVVMKIKLTKTRDKKKSLENPATIFEFYYVLWPSKFIKKSEKED